LTTEIQTIIGGYQLEVASLFNNIPPTFFNATGLPAEAHLNSSTGLLTAFFTAGSSSNVTVFVYNPCPNGSFEWPFLFKVVGPIPAEPRDTLPPPPPSPTRSQSGGDGASGGLNTTSTIVTALFLTAGGLLLIAASTLYVRRKCLNKPHETENGQKTLSLGIFNRA